MEYLWKEKIGGRGSTVKLREDEFKEGIQIISS